MDKLTAQQKKYHIQQLITAKQKLDFQMDKFIEIFGNSEGHLHDVVYSMFDSYLDAVEELVGDEEQWVSYYIYDCRMGEASKNVILRNKGLTKEMVLDNIDALIEVIEYFQTEENRQ